MKHRFRAAAVGVCVLLMALSGATAFAASPVTISDTVTDPDGWLSADQSARISSAASSARAKGLDIYFVTVPDFSGKNMGDWCKQSIKQSGLSTASIAYVIAYKERKHMSCGNVGEPVVSNSQLTTARSAAESALQAADPLTAEATTDAALAFYSSAESSASTSTAKTSSSRTSSAGSSSTKGGFMWVVVLLLVLVGLIAVVVLVRKGAGKGQKIVAGATARDAERARQLVDEANRQLLSADEQVRSADDELAFAQAQFGALRTQEYGTSLQAARAAVSQCFALQQQMNTAASDAHRASLATRIMDALGTAMNDLTEKQRAFASMRDERADLPRQIREAREQLAEFEGRLADTKAELASVSALYPGQMVASLLDNPDQARALLDSAQGALDNAEAAASSSPDAAANALDTARRAMAMANHQMDAVFAAKTDLSAIEDTLTRAIASITSDLSDVTRLGADQAAFAPLVADARKAVDDAQRARSGTGDPLGALEALRTAEATLDAALEPLRSAEEALERKNGAASDRIAEAEALVEQADRHVQGRRGAVDLDTRSQLSQAHSALSKARAAAEPTEAASHAATAAALARQVLAAPVTPSAPAFGAGTPPTFNTGTPQSRGNGSFTGSTLGDFLLWSTIFGSHDHGGWGGHRHDDRDSSWGGGFGGFGGFGGGSSGGDDSPEMGWGGSSF